MLYTIGIFKKIIRTLNFSIAFDIKISFLLAYTNMFPTPLFMRCEASEELFQSEQKRQKTSYHLMKSNETEENGNEKTSKMIANSFFEEHDDDRFVDDNENIFFGDIEEESNNNISSFYSEIELDVDMSAWFMKSLEVAEGGNAVEERFFPGSAHSAEWVSEEFKRILKIHDATTSFESEILNFMKTVCPQCKWPSNDKKKKLTESK
jgi:hypothetical protein